MKTVLRGIFLGMAGVCLFAAVVRAEPVSLPVVAKGKYFTAYGSTGISLPQVLTRLSFNAPHRLESFDAGDQSYEGLLAQTLDALYLEVSDILDVHMYSFHGHIAFVPNRTDVQSIYRQLARQEFSERSFYVHDRNTIYVSVADLTAGMLGHEIAHAILSHYFVVPPPIKVQEILSGYVEYSLRKSSGTLPR